MPGALGVCQPGTPVPGSTDGCPCGSRLVAPDRELRSPRNSLLRSPNCNLQGPVTLSLTWMQAGLSSGKARVWRASVPYTDSGLSSEHRENAPSWGGNMEDSIQQSLGLVSRLTSQAVSTQFCKHLKPLLPRLWAQS